VRPGSARHRDLYCHMLLDTHNPYKPAIIDWPKLAPAERDRLVSELQGSRERNAARGTRHDRFAARLCPNTVARRGAGGPSWSDRTE